MFQDNKPRFVITIGASAGGLNAISEMISHLPRDIDAAVFIVLHLAKVGLADFLIYKLQRYTSYTCKIATDQKKIEINHIYIAPVDQHLLVKDGPRY